MKKPIIRAGLGALAAGMLLAGTQAEAARRPTPPPPSNTDEWALIGLTPDLVASANGGAGVIVGLFDGETDCRHVDLTGHCTDVAISGGRYRRYDQHGTHTAGIIAGVKYGVAPSANIVNYGVFDDRGFVATGTKLRDAWYNSQSRGASIASMSFGCTGTALCFSADEVNAMADPNLKLLFVKAAGNDGVNLANESIAVSSSAALAAMSKTLIVGSVELDKSMSSYSNRAGDGCFMPSGATSCDPNLQWKNYFLVAPGSNIYSTLPNNSYGYMSGTSMATPVVAGVAALLEARWPQLKSTPDKVARILLTTATDLGAPGVDNVYGWGLLNATRAFQAQGNVTMMSANGTSTVMNGTVATVSPTMAKLATALAPVTVYDMYGRDYALGQTNALRVRSNIGTVRQLLGRQLLGMGSQADWAGSFFAEKYAATSFAAFNSPADPNTAGYTPDRSLRMGIDMPFKGGVAQFRMTGQSSARTDFAYDPTLRPLSFFSSTNLLKSSMIANALLNVSEKSRLSLYAVTNSSGSISAAAPDEPFFLHNSATSSTARLALTGAASDQRQHGFGAGYWLQPNTSTVLGFNASYLSQQGGYYDMVTTLPAFGKRTEMVNLGAAASHMMGAWEVSTSGEVTHLRTSAAGETFHVTPANIVSAEVRLRKNGIGVSHFSGMSDSLSLAVVVPPRAVSGHLTAEYLTQTSDGLGQVAASYAYPLSKIGADPVKVEAAYRLQGGSAWSIDLTGGYNLQKAYYGGAGEALATFRLAL